MADFKKQPHCRKNRDFDHSLVLLPLNLLHTYYFLTHQIFFQIVGIHIKPYANDIIKLIIDFWNKGSDSDTPFQNTIMMVVERLINALGGEFKTYIAQLIPLIMKVII